MKGNKLDKSTKLLMYGVILALLIVFGFGIMVPYLISAASDILVYLGIMTMIGLTFIVLKFIKIIYETIKGTEHETSKSPFGRT